MELCLTKKKTISRVITITITVTVFFTIVNMSCSQNRTYLTQQEKAWNPYKGAQVLVFEAVNGRTDTLEITRVEDKQFPDGLGALQNERLRVLVRISNLKVSKRPIEVMLLYIYSKTAQYSSNIDFELFLADGRFWGRGYSIDELESYAEFSVQTQNGIFDDVIRIDDNSNQALRDNDIATIYWSKSVGYVKCIMKDGTTWELINIIEGS